MPFESTPFPAFAWSESRARRWTECRRAHYWAVYHQHNGWLPRADAGRRAAWVLGKLLRGWPAALGISVHARAAECIAACRSGAPLPTAAELRRRSKRELNAVYIASRRHVADFMRSPKRWPVLDAAYYGGDFTGDDLAAAAARLEVALDRLMDCALWPAIRAADPADVIVVGPFHNFTLALPSPADLSSTLPPTGARVTIYAAPDLALRRHPHAPTELWEFKSGQADGVLDQLFVYGLAARASLGRPPVDGGYLGGVVHLGAADVGADDLCAITTDDLDDAVSRITQSVSDMRGPLADVERNEPGPLDAFPRTERRSRCPRCPYRGLCEPDQYPAATHALSNATTHAAQAVASGTVAPLPDPATVGGLAP